METDKNIHSIIIKALDLENASPEKQDEVVEGIGAVIYQTVITRALEEMDDATVDEFEKVTDNDPTPEKLVAFFLEKIPGFEEMMKEEASKILMSHVEIASGLK